MATLPSSHGSLDGEGGGDDDAPPGRAAGEARTQEDEFDSEGFASGCSSGELAGLVTMALKVIEDDGHDGRSQRMRVMVTGARQGMVGDLVEVSHHPSGTAFQLRSKTG